MCSDIILRPHRDHYVCIEVFVNCSDHLHGIREPGSLKLMVAPFVYRPVLPVEYYIVKRYFSFAVLFDYTQKLILCGIALTALPESHRPLRHYRCLSGQGAVTADNIIHILSADEIVIYLISHLGPE